MNEINKTEMKPGTCRSCSSPIYWIGNKIVEQKKRVIVLPDGTVVTGYESHFAYCPESHGWRKPKKEL